MRRIIIIAALAAFVVLAVAATLTTRGGDNRTRTDTAAQSHSAPSHSRAFWAVHHKQP
jgi:hypothetical protein